MVAELSGRGLGSAAAATAAIRGTGAVSPAESVKACWPDTLVLSVFAWSQMVLTQFLFGWHVLRSAHGTAEVGALFRNRVNDAGVKPPMTRTEEEIGAELAALWAAVSKMASSLVWRTGQEIEVPVPQVMEKPVTKQETVGKRQPMWWSWSRVHEGNRRPSRRQSRWAGWSCVNECRERENSRAIRELSPGAHLGSYTDCRGANAADCERDRRSGGVSPT